MNKIEEAIRNIKSGKAAEGKRRERNGFNKYVWKYGKMKY